MSVCGGGSSIYVDACFREQYDTLLPPSSRGTSFGDTMVLCTSMLPQKRSVVDGASLAKNTTESWLHPTPRERRPADSHFEEPDVNADL